MPRTPLLANWTWKLPLPAPFDTIASNVSTVHYSIYNTASTKKATLHSAMLNAILAYLDTDTTITSGSASENAVGTQGDKTVVEYQSHSGEIHAVCYNAKNGKIYAGRYEDPTSSPRVYSLKEAGNTGSALIFALIPTALTDDEFRENYEVLGKCKNDGYPDMDKAQKAAFLLCDNLYRRIYAGEMAGAAQIRLSIPNTGNVPQLTALNLQKGAYSPDSVLFGTFRILTAPIAASVGVTVAHTDFIGHYPLSARTFSPKEELLIPRLSDWYVIPPEVVTICRHAKDTTGGFQPMRNFMLRGPAGTGKTEGAKAIAAGLGLPYLYYTCSANTEVYDFLGQMLPDTGGRRSQAAEYPSLTDIQMDPATAYKKLTGTYDDSVTEEQVYEKLLEVMEQDAKALAGKNASGQHFRYVETPLITAIRNGYLIEIQEPTVIANPGVLVGLNALLDRCASVTLVTGEAVTRHPDTVIVITTNVDYAGCRGMNQSIISRMNLVIDLDEPDEQTLVKRVMGITGCKDKSAVTKMAQIVHKIHEYCQETSIRDGCCGVRELIAWVQSYMIIKDISEAAKYTVLSSASSDASCRKEIEDTCMKTLLAA